MRTLQGVSDLVSRPYAPGDETAIVELMNAVEAKLVGGEFWTEAVVVSGMRGWIRDLERDTRLTFAPDGQLVSTGGVAPPPPGGVRAGTDGGVHPDWWGRGLGRELMVWQLDRLRAIHSEMGAE